MTWKHVGEVSVDAGLLWLGDPCYIIGDDCDTTWPAWEYFCKEISEKDTTQFNFKMGHAGLGVCVSPGYGDGMYPVEVRRNRRGRIAEVRIIFISEDKD
jgi:hypothetical protein